MMDEDRRRVMIRQAKVHHSDMVIAFGANSAEAKAAVGIVTVLEDAPSHPVRTIVRGALGAFVDYLHGQDGMRIGGDNPPSRLNAALDAFTDENGLGRVEVMSKEAWATTREV